MTRHWRRYLRPLALGLTCLLPSAGLGADGTTLAPIDRLVQGKHASAAGQRKPPTGPAVLNDVARPVPFMSEVRVSRTKCAPNLPPDALCPLEIVGRGPTRWVILDPVLTGYLWETRAVVADHVQGPVPQPRVHLYDARKDGPHPILPAYEGENLRARLAFPLRKRWVESRTLTIPKGGILRFSVGVEEPAWLIDSAPVDFIVRAYVGTDGKSAPVELFRRSLDPARVPEDREWKAVELPLEKLEGQKARFRFETLPSRHRDSRPQLPVWGDPTLLAPAPPDGPKRPHVVLVSLDTLRARSLSAFGRELDTSPFFDALAKEGTLFERAFTTYSNTLGSHMSMLTGLYPRTHGVVGRARLSRKRSTIAERMRRADFETAAFTENALLNGRLGFRRGFGLYSENKEIRLGAGASEKTFSDALDWVRDHTDTPFFLFVHTYQVHAPYEPAEPYASLYEPGQHRVPNERLYEQEIRYLDDQLRRLVEELDRMLGAENLLLVVTADHGEEFGEHGATAHAQLYDEVMHVPLLFRWPGRIPADKRVRTPVSLVDIPPTILQLSGIERFRTRDGVSLVPLFRNKGRIKRGTVFGEAAPSFVTHDVREFVGRTATHKCTISEIDEVGHCFDMQADPEESRKLAPDLNDETRALHAAVVEYSQGPKKRPGEKTAPADAMPEPVNPENIDPERRDKLRALGYVE